MFKLIIVLMIKSAAGHTLEMTIGGFDSYEDCSAKKVEVSEQYYGWRNKPTPVKVDGRVLQIYCTK